MISKLGDILFIIMIFVAPIVMVIAVLGGMYWLSPIAFYILLVPTVSLLIIWFMQIANFRVF